MMRAGIYARVSSQREARDQTIEQQLVRARQYIEERGWELREEQVYRDEGYSGAYLSRPALDRLRDDVAFAALDVVVVTAPDRLARNYLHQAVVLEELDRHGVRVEFVERPMSDDPNDQLLLQIRGAVAEYERTLITERMRRGRLAKLRAGLLLPWTRGHYGYQVDPDRPRDPGGVRLDAAEAAVVQQIFAWYLEPDATLYSVSKQLEQWGVTTPRGRPYWSGCSVRAILQDATYMGIAYANRYHSLPAKGRRSALLPVGPGTSYQDKPPEEWIGIAVPAIVAQEQYQLVQEKLAHNQHFAARNTQHHFLLRGLVSCGSCRLTTGARTTERGDQYYICRGRRDPLRRSEGQPCTMRYIPAKQLDELVWSDLCQILLDPVQITSALERAQAGAWLPQELLARQATLQQALSSLEHQQERLLTAYLGGVLDLPEFERKRRELAQKQQTLRAQHQQLAALAQQRIELGSIATSIDAFCQQVRSSLATATFEQKRQLVELLIDHVVVTDEEVEIRYVMPTSAQGARQPFCHLRLDYRRSVSQGL